MQLKNSVEVFVAKTLSQSRIPAHYI